MLDWSLLQSFVLVAENGSLSAAARISTVSQPSLSRHISVLEDQLGVRLFDRTKAGVELTVEGARLLDHAQIMADAASRVIVADNKPIETLRGTVRITASEIVASYLLPNILTSLHVAYPEVQIELIASDETSNLLRREADIAIRMYRPEQLDVITRKIGEMRLGVYAAKSYVERSGMPKGIEDIFEHDVVGYDRSTLIIDGFRRFGVQVDRDFFTFRSDNQVVCWQMVVAGFGIGFNQVRIGENEPAVIKVPVLEEVGTMPVWLTAHSELRSSPRVRIVYDFLASALADQIA